MAGRIWRILKKMHPYMILKGLRYLRHFGPKGFYIRLMERTEPEEVPYGPWYENYRPTREELDRQRKEKWTDPVRFSVAVPVFGTDPVYLRQMIDSVKAQTYPYWELCIAHAAAGEDDPLFALLDEEAAADERIRVRHLSENGGISANTNAALEMAKGDFIAFMDHDDLISEAALYLMAAWIRNHPGTQMLYTDEDKISADGKEHFQPNLKPDFNEDLLRSNNYITHFLAVSRDLLAQAGPLDPACDGAQDYDLIFRCCEKAQQIGHVPEILYHWRVHEKSTADNPISKMYAYEAGRRAIEAHLKRIGTEGEVTCLKDPGFYRVRYPVKKNPDGSLPLISVIIPNKDQETVLEKCISSLDRTKGEIPLEILVVENNSTRPETFEYYRKLSGRKDVRLLRWKDSFNYSAINNYAAAKAGGDYLLFLNNDVEAIGEGWLEEMLGTAMRPDVGAVGARLYYPNDTIQHAGIVIGIGGVAGAMFVGMKREYTGYLHKAALMQDLSAVTAACMLMDAALFRSLGGFEEKLAVAFNDVDLCLRIGKAGKKVVYDPYAELYHHESLSRGPEDSKQKTRRFQNEIEYMRSEWTGLLRGTDPCYNKNLSVSKWNYSLRSGARMNSLPGKA